MHLPDALTLLVFSLGAFLIPLGTGSVGLPAAVGEILYGILVGPHLGGLIRPKEFTRVLAELGFSFLMFLAGLELDFPRIEKAGVRHLGICLLTAVLIFVIASLGALLLGLPLFLLLAFGATSLGIILVTLSELGMARSLVGQTTILVGSLGEFLTIVLLTALGFFYTYGLGWELWLRMAKLGLIFVAAYAILVLLRTFIWWWPARFTRVVADHDPSEVGVRAGMAIMLVFVALATLLGVEGILGAFIAGALFSFSFRGKGALESKLASIGFGFFVPVFFIWVGTEFDLQAVMTKAALLTCGRFLLVSLVAKLLPALLLLLTGLTARQALGAGLLLATPLTLLVAISRIGLDGKIIDAPTASALVLLAIVTGVLLPWLFRLIMRRPEHR